MGVDTLSEFALQISEPIHPEHVRICKEIMGLQVEESLAPLSKASLKPYESGDVLVIFSQVVQ